MLLFEIISIILCQDLGNLKSCYKYYLIKKKVINEIKLPILKKIKEIPSKKKFCLGNIEKDLNGSEIQRFFYIFF